MKQDDLFEMLAIVALYFGVGFFIGLMDSGVSRNSGKSGCEYTSIAAYVSPGYLAACELFRARFNLEKK